MDAVSYALSAKQKERIERVIANPDSDSGVVTYPLEVAAGETIHIPAGRGAVLPNVQVDGTLNIEGEVFIPSGATFGDLESQIASKVSLNKDETIAGVKTFSSSPIVPTPTAGTQVANKAYADLKVALASFSGTNQSLGTTSGYQKLPGGLIIQWGYNSTSSSDITITFPIAFTTKCRGVYGNQYVKSTSAYTMNPYAINTTQFSIRKTSTGSPVYWYAIGY